MSAFASLAANPNALAMFQQMANMPNAMRNMNPMFASMMTNPQMIAQVNRLFKNSVLIRVSFSSTPWCNNNNVPPAVITTLSVHCSKPWRRTLATPLPPHRIKTPLPVRIKIAAVLRRRRLVIYWIIWVRLSCNNWSPLRLRHAKSDSTEHNNEFNWTFSIYHTLKLFVGCDLQLYWCLPNKHLNVKTLTYWYISRYLLSYSTTSFIASTFFVCLSSPPPLKTLRNKLVDFRYFNFPATFNPQQSLST